MFGAIAAVSYSLIWVSLISLHACNRVGGRLMYWNFQTALMLILCGIPLLYKPLQRLVASPVSLAVILQTGFDTLVEQLFICCSLSEKFKWWLLGYVACLVCGDVWKVFCWCWRWYSLRTYKTNLKRGGCHACLPLLLETLWVNESGFWTAGEGAASIVCVPLPVPL